MVDHDPYEQRRRTLHAVHVSHLDSRSVWLRYFAITGDLEMLEVDAYLNGMTMLDALDRDLVSHAVNELINELIVENQPPAAPFSTDAEEKPTEKSTEKSREESTEVTTKKDPPRAD